MVDNTDETNENNAESKKPKLFPPQSVLDQMIFWADSQGCGMSSASDDNTCIIVIGSKTMPVELVMMIAAHNLLGGIIDGLFTITNETANLIKEAEDKAKGVKH